MTIWEIVFICQFIAVIGITGFKLYNLMNKGEKAGIGVSILLFCAFWLCWFTGLIIFLNNFAEQIYAPFFLMENLFIVLMVAFFIGEVLINLGVISVSGVGYNDPIKRYDPQKK